MTTMSYVILQRTSASLRKGTTGVIGMHMILLYQLWQRCHVTYTLLVKGMRYTTKQIMQVN